MDHFSQIKSNHVTMYKSNVMSNEFGAKAGWPSSSNQNISNCSYCLLLVSFSEGTASPAAGRTSPPPLLSAAPPLGASTLQTGGLEPAKSGPAQGEVAAVQPVMGISQRVRTLPKKKKDLGTLGKWSLAQTPWFLYWPHVMFNVHLCLTFSKCFW